MLAKLLASLVNRNLSSLVLQQNDHVIKYLPFSESVDMLIPCFNQ